MTWIKADDYWSLWAVVVGLAAAGIYLEQRYRWAERIGGAIIALVGALLLANSGLLPTESPVYSTIWDYVAPLAVAIMLFKADLRSIWKESGRTFGAFHVAVLGTVMGSVAGVFLLARFIPEALQVASMITASYIGGTVNLMAVADTFKATQNAVNASIVADNLNMALYFFVLLTIPSLLFFHSHYKHPYEDAVGSATNEGVNKAAAYWGRKEISLLDIAKIAASGFTIVALSVKLAGYVEGFGHFDGFLKSAFANKYVVITTLTVLTVTLFPRFFQEVHGSQEIGTFFIYIFLVGIGLPASIKAIAVQGPAILAFCMIVALFNLLVTLLLGKLLGFNLEELLIASNATVGGPATAAAMAISKGWNDLVFPAILVGIWGYVIGSYCAIYLGNEVFPKLLG